jgi:hypothetical protein
VFLTGVLTWRNVGGDHHHAIEAEAGHIRTRAMVRRRRGRRFHVNPWVDRD